MIMEDLRQRPNIRQEYRSKKPFQYASFDGIFYPEKADPGWAECLSLRDGKGDDRTYCIQKKNFSIRILWRVQIWTGFLKN